ncbi:MAG: nuclear transport factor 2 family protein [Chloroflexi bacterium]|nr:nuclear transport factor 2 family protein [Chloroflexota bacterium]
MPLTTEDRLAIEQLYARYNHAIDSGKGPEWAACFTPDGVFTSPNGTFTGTEQLAGFGSSLTQRLKVRHWINNLVLDADGDGAKGTCYLVLWQLKEGAPAAPLITAIYVDTLSKAGGDWRFSSRTVNGD